MNKRLLAVALLVSAEASAQVSIHPLTVTPDISPAVNKERGMRLTTEVAGTAVGLRYWKLPGETGVHTLTLWRRTGSTTGTKLVSITTTNETASGWQNAFLPVHKPLIPGEVYVISYNRPGTQNVPHKPGGLLNAGINAFPLRAPKHATGAPNCVTGSTPGAYPTTAAGGCIFYVDVIFAPGHCGIFQ